jgi:hypothetical protein
MKLNPFKKTKYPEPCYTYDNPWNIETYTCKDCGQSHLSAVCFVLEHGKAKAIARMGHFGHQMQDEVYFEVCFGDFADDNAAWKGNVTFQVRLGSINKEAGEAFTLCDPGKPDEEDSVFGKTLTRKQALRNEHVADLWRVIDFIVLSPEYHNFVKQAEDR